VTHISFVRGRPAPLEEFLSHFDLDAVREILDTDFEISPVQHGSLAFQWRVVDLQGHVLDLSAFEQNTIAPAWRFTATGQVILVLYDGVPALQVAVGSPVDGWWQTHWLELD
jgi:hypothetical protein